MHIVAAVILLCLAVDCTGLFASRGTYICETGKKCVGSKNVGTVHGVEYCCRPGDSMSLHTDNVTGFAKTYCHCGPPPYQLCLKNEECSSFDYPSTSTINNVTYCCSHGKSMSMASMWVHGHEWVECYCGTSVTTADVQMFGASIDNIITNLSQAFWEEFHTEQNLATLLSL